jgi:hypothetical protein
VSATITEVPLGGNLRMTLERSPKANSVGVYRRVGGGAQRTEHWVAFTSAAEVSIVSRVNRPTSALWVGHTKFEVPTTTVPRIAEFFGIAPCTTEAAA